VVHQVGSLPETVHQSLHNKQERQPSDRILLRFTSISPKETSAVRLVLRTLSIIPHWMTQKALNTGLFWSSVGGVGRRQWSRPVGPSERAGLHPRSIRLLSQAEFLNWTCKHTSSVLSHAAWPINSSRWTVRHTSVTLTWFQTSAAK
jgi:hypothetical protein